MINRTEYLDDHGLQVDPLFDIVDGLHKELEAKDQKIKEISNALVKHLHEEDSYIDEIEANKKEIVVLKKRIEWWKGNYKIIKDRLLTKEDR